jgi:D-alanyl-D-alanine endopeptidase (penicillin-binding protein 7)
MCFSVALAALFFGLSVPTFVQAAASKVLVPQMKKNSVAYRPVANEFAAAIVVDSATGKELYSFKPTLKWTAASLSKLAAALVAVDHHPAWAKGYAMSSRDEVGGGRLRVNSGTVISARDMFFASIVGSANNTTMSLARLSGLGAQGFVNHMNSTVKALGAKNSKFYEPSGMNPKNVTTAADMAKIAQAAFSNTLIRTAATTGSYNVRIVKTGAIHMIKNTNPILTVDPEIYVLGGKTGYLEESKYNFVLKAQPIDRSKPALTVVVLGAPTKESSFASGKSLAQWAWDAYDWVSPKTPVKKAK